jgi:hypothetical protein
MEMSRAKKKTYYKVVVYDPASRKLHSAVATNRTLKTYYSTKNWTHAKKSLLALGYGLMVFENFYLAKSFADYVCFEKDYRIYEAECRNPREAEDVKLLSLAYSDYSLLGRGFIMRTLKRSSSRPATGCPYGLAPMGTYMCDALKLGKLLAQNGSTIKTKQQETT